MAFTGGQYAVTATAVNIATALSISNPGILEAREITIAYNHLATAAAYMGPSTVTNVPANAAFAFPLVAANIPTQIYRAGNSQGSKSVNLSELFLVGTVNALNIFFIAIIY